jgi:hypothetical protein
VTSFCVQNRQVFGLHRLNQQPETLFKVQFIQDSDLNRVWFRQVYWVELCFALQCLRHELTPMKYNTERVHELSS